MDLGLNTGRLYKPEFPALDGTNIFDPTTYTMSRISYPTYGSSQLNFQGGASAGRRYSVSDHYGIFELGLKIRNGHKIQNENDQIFNPTGNFPLSQVLGSFSNPTYYDHDYTVGPFSDYGKIHQLVASNLTTGFT